MLCIFKRGGVGWGLYLKPSHCSRLQIRFDVSWIQVGNAHKKAWSRERPEFPKAKTRVLYKRKRDQTDYHLQTTDLIDLLFYHIESNNISFSRTKDLRCWTLGVSQFYFHLTPFMSIRWPLLCPNKSPSLTCSFPSASHSKTGVTVSAAPVPNRYTNGKKKIVKKGT